MAPGERILLTGTAPDGGRFDLVAYGNNHCGISRNGTPDPHWQWRPCDLDAPRARMNPRTFAAPAKESAAPGLHAPLS